MKILRWISAVLAFMSLYASAQQSKKKTASSWWDAMVAEPRTFPLWQTAAPGAQGASEIDIPTLTYYPPVNPVGTAVIIAPGGGYVGVAINHEGRQIANWLNAMGISAFVLRYRVGPKYHHPIELSDVQRALRLVRSREEEFGVRPDRIGIMGFSAGGHLASSAATHFDDGNHAATDPIDQASCRPDFAILVYAVISLVQPYAHHGSVVGLLGENPDPKLLNELSGELQVTSRTPPTFLFSTGQDKDVPPENSVAYYLALRRAGVPAELHVFEKGGHGAGLALRDPTLGMWPTLLIDWLRSRGLLENAPKS